MNASRRTKLLQASLTIAIGILLVGMCLAQQNSQEPAQPALRVQTDLVVVPFQVRRGSRSVSDLKPSDVVLLEDGVPRAFTGFESPQEHPTLDLVVMFEVTDQQRGGFWSAKMLDDMVGSWNETMAQALVEEPGAIIRVAIYQFDKSRLRRLSRPTSDPKELVAALKRLTDPIPSGHGFDLQVPRGVVLRPETKEAQLKGGIPWSRSLLGAIAVLRDSAAGPTMSPRALVIFSPGAEGTSVTPQDLADEGLAANVPIYPVVLPSNQWIWYEGEPTNGPNGQFLQLGQCVKPLRPDGGFRGFDDCPLNKPFESVGISTGGRGFEAPRGPGSLEEKGINGFSMTAGQVENILEAVKRHALARFTSSYTLWFAPSSSSSPRQHKLEVRLADKSGGKITDGKRSASY